MEKHRKKRGNSFSIFQLCSKGAKNIFILAMVVFTLYPVIYILIGSFKTNAELTSGVRFFPEKWQFQNYY